jgi:hypothetical protein
MKASVGEQFVVIVADGYVLMEVSGLRCGDVWDCNPVDTGGRYADEYGHHMVFTDEQVAEKVRRHKQRSASRSSVWSP